MPTLHAVTEDVRESFKWGMIGLISIIVLISLYNVLKTTIFKPKPILPTMIFGALSPIPFPKNTITQRFSYLLDTVDGTTNVINPMTNQTQTIPDVINVYKITRPQPDLTSLQTAKDEVQTLGFVLPEKRLTETEYEWDKTDGLPKSITMDIASNNFSLTSPYLTYPAVLSSANAPTDNSALNTVQNALSAMQLAPSDIDSSLTTITDYVIDNGTLRQALPGENVMAVRINFFQKAVNNYPMLYPYSPDTTMNFLVTGGDTQPEIAQATYIHQLIDTATYSTYALKSPNQAYADLRNGKAYIMPMYTGGNLVNIRTINLGYYIGETIQNYLIPVYEFLGDNNFTAYVSAISPTSQ